MASRRRKTDRKPAAPLVAVLGERILTVRELLGLRRNTILALDRVPDEALELFVGERGTGSGRVLTTRSGRRFAVRIESLRDPPTVPKKIIPERSDPERAD